ncbi:unnamed protein product [Lactuca saligna]|uniref:DUF4283 domain-containing protein n=1 Tax=Lactuca saligna TaxID=75948 RepID=A0AA35VMZ0_LACSI|nr:unnamed protein product [Lactuca saligna]
MVLLLFDHSVAAKEFMEQEYRWKEHLKWVRWGDKVETHGDRVAWIRILGLPLRLWGQRNFQTITGGFGKIIAPFEDIPHRVDLSHIKIGLLTTRRNRINDEIRVAFEGKVYKLGIIEFDEDWFPFRFDDDEDYVKLTGIKEKTKEVVQKGKENDEMEEGEIRPESGGTEAQGPENSRVPTIDSEKTEVEDEESHGEPTGVETSRKTDESTLRNKSITNGTFHPTCHVDGAYRVTHNNPNSVYGGPNIGLPLINCFGPFPAPSACGINNDTQMIKVGRSNGKRRRIVECDDLTPNIVPLMELEDDTPYLIQFPFQIPHLPISKITKLTLIPLPHNNARIQMQLPKTPRHRNLSKLLNWERNWDSTLALITLSFMKPWDKKANVSSLNELSQLERKGNW